VKEADLLKMNQMALNRMKTNWPQKSLEPFVDNGLIMKTDLVEVVAKNSPTLFLFSPVLRAISSFAPW
jgi:hypothetical protein